MAWLARTWLAFRCVAAALLFVAIGSHSRVTAQDYPTRPITIVVTLSAGTGMDVIARLYAEKLSQRLGKPVVIENKPGAGTMLGTAAVASAPPDGYTLLVATSAALSINPTVYKQLAYDPERDLVPVSLYLKSPFILIVNPSLPVQTVPELIDYARKSPTPLNYSSPGTGGLPYLSVELMNHHFGLKMTHVPYRNSPQAVSDVAAGHVSLSIAEAGASLALIRDGRVRALAVTSTQPLLAHPSVPPMAEAANAPGFETVSWHVLMAPAKTPRPIVEKLHGEMTAIMSDPEMQKRLSDLGLLPLNPPSIVDTERYIKSETEKWSSLVEKLGLKGSQ
jgi:tripartite-type tricarboxylate transporter receptor subunit TctC